MAELGGADCITLHLREDRRHIIDRDVRVALNLCWMPSSVPALAKSREQNAAPLSDRTRLTITPRPAK